MRTHIDWLTFTGSMAYRDEATDGYSMAVTYGMDDLLGQELADKVLSGSWVRRERSRAPYTEAYDLSGQFITLFVSPNLTHFCIEISGQGCELLIERGLMNEVLTKCHERVTRIDIAIDIETNVKPTEFVQSLKHERMRASGYQTSSTGETCYIGSLKSDRYARVYRYNEPHPRSKLLRIEHVFRRKQAKSVALACLGDSIESVTRAAGDAFGWSHSIWLPGNVQASNISVDRAESGMGGTVRWLIKSCAPAFRRMVSEGKIRDPEAFFREYFMSRSQDGE